MEKSDILNTQLPHVLTDTSSRVYRSVGEHSKGHALENADLFVSRLFDRRKGE